MNMWNRIKSPVVLGSVLGVSLVQWNILAGLSSVSIWDIGSFILTVGISFVAALNNPTNKEGF